MHKNLTFVVALIAALVLPACGGNAVTEGTSGSGGTTAEGGSGGTGETGGTGGGETGGTGATGGVGATGGSDTGGSGGATGGTGGIGGSCADCAAPPAPDPNAPPGDGPGATFAMSYVYLGDTNVDGSPSATAWKQFGYDIDGQISDKSSAYHCKVQDGGSTAAVKTDGADGIDNSFGANLLPVFLGIASDASARFNEAIQEGSGTHLIRIGGLGAGSSYAGLDASVFVTGELGKVPVWDGSDLWPVLCEQMNTCLPAGTPQIPDGNESLSRYPDSYVVDGVWVSNGDAPFFMSFLFVDLPFPIRLTRISLDLNNPSSMGAGRISGVIDTEEFVQTFVKAAGYISTSLCGGPTLESIKQSVAAASDILKDGTQDPNQLCDGISIGLGFNAKPAQVGAVLDARPILPDPCE